MSESRIRYRPPTPKGEPFRGDRGDPAPFPIQGAEFAPSTTQHPPLGPYVLPPGGITAGEIPPSPTYAEAQAGLHTSDQPPAWQGQAPIFTKPGGGPVADVSAADDLRRRARNAVTIGVVSLLFLHIPLGPIAIAMGVKAYRGGERRNGAWAIGTGVGGTLIGIVGVILWATGVLPTLDELMERPK